MVRYKNIDDILSELKSKSDESRSLVKGQHFFFRKITNDLADRENKDQMVTTVHEMMGGNVNVEIRYPSIGQRDESRSSRKIVNLDYLQTPEGLVLRRFHSSEEKDAIYGGKIVQLSALRNAKSV